MSDRQYSVDEIARMRKAVSMLLHPVALSAYRGPSKIAEIEDQLRTYMLNGTDPEELEELAQAARQIRYPALAGTLAPKM
jgi:hypothetical protein